MVASLFDNVKQITENPEHLVRIFLPHLRGISYFADKSICDSKIEEVFVLEFMRLIPDSKISAIVEEVNSLNNYLLSREIKDSKLYLPGMIKDYLCVTDHISSLNRFVGIIASRIKREESLDTHIVSFRERLKSIFLGINDERYKNLVDNYIFIGYYAIGTCLMFRLAELLHSSWRHEDIVRVSLIFCIARMEYELRNLHQSQWQPMLVNLLCQNGGRFFRLCKVSYGDMRLPLFKTISNSLVLNRAITPDWRDTLFNETRRAESINNIGLNRLFLFYEADVFITFSLLNKQSYIDVIKSLKPYPDLYTLKRFFNLYLLSDLYNSAIDVKTWQPPLFIKDYLFSGEMNYEEKERVLRDEYFPSEVFDLNALLKYAEDYYNEKTRLDFEYGNWSELNKLDDKSIWYLSEWLIKERSYCFLKGLDNRAIADMIAKKILRDMSPNMCLDR